MVCQRVNHRSDILPFEGKFCREMMAASGDFGGLVVDVGSELSMERNIFLGEFFSLESIL